MSDRKSTGHWEKLGVDPRTFTAPEQFNEFGKNHLPETAGVEITRVDRDRFEGRMPVRHGLLAPNGFLHAASVVALADTLTGYATIISLPEGAASFTTVELKSNHTGTATEGVVTGAATPVHRGRTTQVWDCVVTPEGSDKPIAHFRCTQAILWPR